MATNATNLSRSRTQNPGQFEKTVYFILCLSICFFLTSCISNNLRQAREMMEKKQYDDACHWYDEALAELVPSNWLKLERLEACRAACRYHISEAKKKLEEGNLPFAVMEAKSALKYAREVTEFQGQAQQALAACAEAYAQRASENPLNEEIDYTQAISDYENAVNLQENINKKNAYLKELDKVKASFAEWLKNHGRLTEASDLLREIHSIPDKSKTLDFPTDASKQVAEEIKEKKHEARNLIKRGELCIQKGLWEEAISSFRKARKIDNTLYNKASYGEKRAIDGQFREKTASAISNRNWDEAEKFVEKWKKYADYNEIEEVARIIDGGRTSDDLFQSARVDFDNSMLNGASKTITRAMKLPGHDLEALSKLDTEIRKLKLSLIEQANISKNLAMEGKFDDSMDLLKSGEEKWADWDGWSKVKTFIEDEIKRKELIDKAENTRARGEYAKAFDNYRKALHIRYDIETDNLYKESGKWLNSYRHLEKAKQKLANQQIRQAIGFAEQALDEQPKNKEAGKLLINAKRLNQFSIDCFKRAKDAISEKDWRKAIEFLTKCTSNDTSFKEAYDYLDKAKTELRKDNGIIYSNESYPVHAALRHPFAWLVIVGVMALMMIFRKSVYVRFGALGLESSQLQKREKILSEERSKKIRIVISIVFIIIISSLLVFRLVYEYKTAGMLKEAVSLQSSDDLLEARQSHQAIVENRPLSCILPASRYAIHDISKKLPFEDHVIIQDKKTFFQKCMGGSRAFSSYAIDYPPIMASFIAIGILTFLFFFRLKKHLLPRFVILCFALPSFMVILLEFFTILASGDGNIYITDSTFGLFIPQIASAVGLAISVVLCFLGTITPEAGLQFLARRRADLKAIQKDTDHIMVFSKKSQEQKIKEELPWMPNSETKPKAPKKQMDFEEKIPLTSSGKTIGRGDIKEDSKQSDTHELQSEEEFKMPDILKKEGRDMVSADDLAEMLNNGEKEVRIEAARALGFIGDTRALEPLIEALDDSEEEVREAAEQSLRKVGKEDLDLLKIVHKKEKNPAKKERLRSIIASASGVSLETDIQDKPNL